MPSAATPSLPAAPAAAFRHHAFRLFAASTFLSNVAAQMMGVAIGWQVYAVTHRAIDLGYVGLVQFVPSFWLSLPAGHVADRVNRARLVAWCNVALATCALALLAVSVRGHASVLPIYAVLALVGAARAFEGPANAALLPGIVPAGDFPNAVTWNSTMWQVSTIVGPSIGGVLYGAAQGPTAVYATCAVILAISAALVFVMPYVRTLPRDDAKAGTWAALLEGLRYVGAHRVILACISLDLFAVLLGGATALLPVYASDVLHVGPFGLGVLRSGPAVGASVIAVALAHRPLQRRTGPIMLACVALFGVGTIVFGLSRSFPLSLAALVVLGAADMVSVVIRSTLVQLRTPHEMRGRVSAVNMMFVLGSNELGELESGVTAAWLGAVPAVVLGGIGTIVVVAIYTFLFAEIREVDRLDQVG